MRDRPIDAGAARATELALRAVDLREETVRLITRAKHGHIGGALSECDIMTALFHEIMTAGPDEPAKEDHDLFVLSKGHCCEPYYCCLHDLGYFGDDVFDSFCAFGGLLTGHPNTQVPGIEIATGALGHGLSVACGAALARKRRGMRSEVFTILGDGELGEGSNWEAAMFAGNYGLDNLYVILDRNGLQLSGATEDVMRLEDLSAKWRAFGFDVEEIDGNDMGEILDVFARLRPRTGRPKCVLAHTVKGRGVSFMENRLEWHAGWPDEAQLAQVLAEFDAARAALSAEAQGKEARDVRN